MTFLSVFPFLAAGLDVGAACVYAYHRQWALAVTWACYSVAAYCLGLVKST
jgi:hypothetical protein